MPKKIVFVVGCFLIFCILLLFYLKVSNETLTKAPTENATRNYKNQALAATFNDDVELTNKDKATALDCSLYLEAELFTVESREHYLNVIESTYKSYYDERLDEQVVDIISLRTGIGASLGRYLLNGREHPVGNPKFYSGKITEYSSRIIVSVNDFLEHRNIYKFVSAISTDSFSSNTVFYIKGEPHFLLGRLINSGIVNYNDIALLLEHGASVFLSDLVSATKIGLDVDTVSMMHAESRIVASSPIEHNGRKLSLLNYAIAYGHYELALYWLSAGSPVEPDKFALNGLDILVKYREEFTDEEIVDLSSQMLKAGFSPNSSKRRLELSKILSAAGIGQYNKLLQIAKKEPFQKEQSEIAAIMEREFYKSLIGERGIDTLCLSFIGRNVIEYALKRQKEEKPLAEEKHSVNSAVDVESNQVVSQTHSKSEAFQSIFDKQIHERKSLESLNIDAQTVKEELSNLREEHEEIASVYEIIKLAMNERWDEAFSAINKLNPATRKELYPALIDVAVSQKHNVTVVISLVELGGKPNESSILNIVKANNVEAAQYLLDKGLFINYLDPLGKGALAYSVEYKNLEIFHFLLENGVQVVDTTLGYDALDYALMDYDPHIYKDSFIRHLLFAGIEVEISHKQWLERLADTDLESYSHLINKYPILK